MSADIEVCSACKTISKTYLVRGLIMQNSHSELYKHDSVIIMDILDENGWVKYLNQPYYDDIVKTCLYVKVFQLNRSFEYKTYT